MKRFLLICICIHIPMYCADEGKANVKPHPRHRRSSAADEQALHQYAAGKKAEAKKKWREAGKAVLQESQSGTSTPAPAQKLASK